MILNRNDLPQDWGPSALECRRAGQHLGQLSNCPSDKASDLRQCDGLRQADQRLAVERHRHAAERISVHAAGRLEPLGRWRHAQSGPALAESGVHRPGDHREPESVVQSECVRRCPPRAPTAISAAAFISGPGLAEVDLSLFKNTALTERTNLQFRAEFFNVLNHANFGYAERDRVFERTRSVRRRD